MDEVSYFILRARYYFQLALEAVDPKLKAAFFAISDGMSAKVVKADRNRRVFLKDGVPIDASSDVPHKLQPGDRRLAG
jgi:hypothetical protein